MDLTYKFDNIYSWELWSKNNGHKKEGVWILTIWKFWLLLKPLEDVQVKDLMYVSKWILYKKLVDCVCLWAIK